MNLMKTIQKCFAHVGREQKMNKAILNDLPGESYTIETNGKFLIMLITHWNNSSCSESEANKTVGLVKLTKFTIVAKLTLN